MDPSGLRERIKATLDPNANNRQAAEVELKAVGANDVFCGTTYRLTSYRRKRVQAFSTHY